MESRCTDAQETAVVAQETAVVDTRCVLFTFYLCGAPVKERFQEIINITQTTQRDVTEKMLLVYIATTAGLALLDFALMFEQKDIPMG